MFKYLTSLLLLGLVVLGVLTAISYKQKGTIDKQFKESQEKINKLTADYLLLEGVHIKEINYRKHKERQDSIKLATLKKLHKRDSLLILQLTNVSLLYKKRTGNQLINLLDSAYDANHH